MSNNRIKKSTKPILLSLFLSMLLLLSSSCMITGESEAEIIEQVVQKIASMDGKMTVVSKDGETITLTITKETSEDSSNPVDPASILPSLGCIEDVFKVLGVWEDAHALREEGIQWSHIAEELGYTKDKMHAHLLEIAEVKLKEAKESGLIEQEMVEKKLAYFSEIALKWVYKIFADTEKSTVDLSSILPSLGCIEDVFKVLGVWEDAHALREEGIQWSHIAEELGYTKDKMHAHLLEIAEVRLKEAKESGLIEQEMVEKKLAYFSEIALKWVHKIFADTEKSTVDLSSILPSLGCIEDVFKVLGVWEDAHALREEGIQWSHIAEELGYTKDTMHAHLLEITEVRLKEAKESGLIEQEMVEKKLAYFSEIALKWVHKIFVDTEKSTVDPASILPSLGCIEDVFKVLGVWEDAHALREEGLQWSHIAEELGYTKDTMHAHLLEITEVRLKEAKESGLIEQEMVEKKLAYFSEIALKWVHKVFAE